jgi:DNA-binding MarR family transcriptional regulator
MSRTSLQTEHGSPDDSAGLQLWRVTNRWQAAQRAALKPFELTHVQFVLLASLTWLATDGPVTQRHLADMAGTDLMMTSQVLRALEQRDLVRRDPHPDDSRARAVSATDAGKELANRAVRDVEGCDREFFGPLAGELGAFTASLRLLAERSDRK